MQGQGDKAELAVQRVGRHRNDVRRAGFRAALALFLATVGVPALVGPIAAQDATGLTSIAGQPDPDAQLLLQADELVYDYDNETITALGNVRIDYDDNRLVADRVVYIQRTGRLQAIGQVEILQPDGTRLTADEIDITDDFGDGFINTLRVVTPENTRFTAETAIRRDGKITIFNRGIYTACEPCQERPERPPLWQVKSQRTIWNSEEKTIRFEQARFEFLGIPIAYLPVFTAPDPTVRRKTGVLAPGFRYAEELGFGLSVPYFINLAPNYDLKLTGTGFTRQGFLAEAEFRHRLENGIYTLKAAGIHQLDPDAFRPNTSDALNTNRGMIGSTGQFQINPLWEFGWNVLAQSDRNFARTYNIDGFSDSTFRQEIYLTGLSDRNYFDARLMRFDVQAANPNAPRRQPWVLPSLDYDYVVDRSVAGGELAFTVNSRGISRDINDRRGSPGLVDDNFATFGASGQSWRMTAETEWRRNLIMPGGLAVTPLLHARGDGTVLQADTGGELSQTMEDAGVGLASDGSYWDGMVTAGLEVRWPILFSTASSTHILEPIGQVFVRPDARSDLVLPNEDAQSLVFDAASLFERDKFSGFDRIEGGTRANLGLRYNGQFAHDFSVSAIFGQSFQLAGTNPFTAPDLVNVGADSGLETDRSDYVGSVSLSHGSGISLTAGGRFDEQDFELRQAGTGVSFSNEAITLSATYALTKAQPTYGFAEDRQDVTVSGAVRFAEYWQVSAAADYDLTNAMLDNYSIGLGYDDECFAFKLTFNEDRSTTGAIERNIGIRLVAKTLGDINFGSSSLPE